MIGDLGPATEQCSRTGCRTHPEWTINWRNPKLHDAGYVKTWLSCAEHREFFVDYFENRGFPVSVSPFGVLVDTVEDGAT